MSREKNSCGDNMFLCLKWVRRNFWRMVYHLLCCCCYNDRNLKYQMPTHYLVEDNVGNLELAERKSSSLQTQVNSYNKSLEILLASPVLIQNCVQPNGDIIPLLGPHVCYFDKKRNRTIKMSISDWLLGKGCPGWKESSCDNSDTDSWKSALSVDRVEVEECDGECGIGSGEGIGEVGGVVGDGVNGGIGGEVGGGVGDGVNGGIEGVLLYFSASWCPPCQKLTPRLAKWYRAYQDIYWGDGEKKKNMKMIDFLWVSVAEKHEDEYLEYFKKMAWGGTPFASPYHWLLSKRININSFPTLVLVRIHRDRRGCDIVSVTNGSVGGELSDLDQELTEAVEKI